jgi:hypothetical protein
MLLKQSMYHKLLQCVHPDQSASADTRREVLQWVMKELKPYAVPDNAPGTPRSLPNTWGLMQEGERRRQANIERGKRAAATRKKNAAQQKE